MLVVVAAFFGNEVGRGNICLLLYYGNSAFWQQATKIKFEYYFHVVLTLSSVSRTQYCDSVLKNEKVHT